MFTCRRLEDLPSLGAPLHLALGVFDGVHIGHQEVIRRAIQAARSEGGLAGVITFDPHPIQVIAPQKAPSSLLASLDHKARLVAHLGTDLFAPLHFDTAFASLSAQDFLANLLLAPVKTIAVGEDWRFGHLRRGDVDFLRHQAESCGFTLEAVPPVMWEGDRVSSTRIRQAIQDGNLTAAAHLLGRPYSVSGTVIHGRQLGRTLGFPTANLAMANAQLPPDGVWAVHCRLNDTSIIPGVANLGLRPTVDGAARSLEVHLLDFSGDLYDTELEIEFKSFIRKEIRFPSLDALKDQIHADSQRARTLLEISENPA